MVDRLQQRGVEGRDVVGPPAGDQVAVHHDLLVDPVAARVADVGLQARPGGQPAAADDTPRKTACTAAIVLNSA